MKKIYAPWRHDYVTKSGDYKKKAKKNLKNDCVFCDQFEQNDDDQYLILQRREHCAVMMNYYPYNAGHLMVLPFEHKANLHEISSLVRSEMMEAANDSVQILEKKLKCQGFNVGFNLGEAGGGGIPSHLHMHILPRWIGDTNFIATLGETTLICSDFRRVFDDLKGEFK